MHALNIFGSTHDPEVQKARKKFSSMTTKTVHGHLKRANTVAWNNTGEKLASSSLDDTVRIWTGIDRKASHTDASTVLKGHTMNVTNVCWSPSSAESLVSISDDTSIRLWDTRTGQCSLNLDGKYVGHNVAWCPDSNTIIVGGRHSSSLDVLLHIDTRASKIRKIVKYHYSVNEISWNKEGNCVYLTTGTGDVEMWSWPEFKQIKSISVNNCPIYCLDFAPNGKNFALGCQDSLVSFWDVKDHVCTKTFGNLSGIVKSVRISHDNQYIASGSDDNFIDISHLESGENIYSLKNEAVSSLAWHPTKHLLAIAGRDKDRHERETGAIKVFGLFQTF
jgi:THO complex subunit 3